MFKKFFTLIICAVFANFFSSCAAQKEVPQAVNRDFFMEDVTLNSGYKMPRL